MSVCFWPEVGVTSVTSVVSSRLATSHAVIVVTQTEPLLIKSGLVKLAPEDCSDVNRIRTASTWE